MSHARRILCLLISAAAVTLLAQSPAAHKDEGCTDEDYAVYTAGLSDLFGEAKTVMLIDRTSTGLPPGMAAVTQVGGEAQTLAKQIPEAKTGFDARNKTSAKIDYKKMQGPFTFLVLTPEQAGKQLRGDGWKWFHKRYPDVPGITVVSRPGYSMGHDRALLYVGTSCDMLCGDGFLLLLEKQGHGWAVVSKARAWQS